MLIIIRGLPGSGKSTLAKRLGIVHFERDMFFTKNGNYNFDMNKVPMSNNWMHANVHLNLATGNDVVITGIYRNPAEMQWYIDFCKDFNIKYRIVRCLSNFGNVHNVPKELVNKFESEFIHVDKEFYYRGEQDFEDLTYWLFGEYNDVQKMSKMQFRTNDNA